MMGKQEPRGWKVKCGAKLSYSTTYARENGQHLPKSLKSLELEDPVEIG